MASLGRLWNGRLYGTNIGNLAAEFKSDGSAVVATIRFNDERHGVAVYEGAGDYVDGKLSLTTKPTLPASDEQFGTVTLSATLGDDGQLRGEWSSTTGPGGTFHLFPHDPPSNTKAVSTGVQSPEQIHSANRDLGAVRLYGNDTVELIEQFRRDFLNGRVIVTRSEGKHEVSEYAEDFLNALPKFQRLSYLKLSVQEPDTRGINRTVTIELSARGENFIRVQGPNQSWVIGKSESLHSFMRRYESFIVAKYKKFGLGINQIVFLAMLVVIPEIESLVYRTLFVGGVLLGFSGLAVVHGKMIPNAAIYGTAKQPGAFRRALPNFWSWFITVAATVAAALILQRVTGSQDPSAVPPAVNKESQADQQQPAR